MRVTQRAVWFFLASALAAAGLVVVLLSYSWFLGSTFAAVPLLPGEYIARLMRPIGIHPSPNLAAALFLFYNFVFWTVVFLAVANLTAKLLRR
jgi:hypothetical protein